MRTFLLNPEFLKQGSFSPAVRKGLIIGALSGAALGGLIGYLPKHRYSDSGKKIKFTRAERVGNSVLGAFTLGASGGRLGYAVGDLKDEYSEAKERSKNHSRDYGEDTGGYEGYKKRYGVPGDDEGTPSSPHDTDGAYNDYQAREARTASKLKHLPDWLKGAKTKAEASAIYKKRARAMHPDLQPAHKQKEHMENFKKLQEEWNEAQKHTGFPKHAMAAFSDELLKIMGVL